MKEKKLIIIRLVTLFIDCVNVYLLIKLCRKKGQA